MLSTRSTSCSLSSARAKTQRTPLSSAAFSIRCAARSAQSSSASATAGSRSSICPASGSAFSAISNIQRIYSRQRQIVSCRATAKPTSIPGPGGDDDNSNLLGSIGIGALWLGLLAYAFAFSPNQTPYRDEVFIKLLVGLEKDTTFSVNTIYYSIFNLMGVYPIIYSALMIPSGRSGNKVPAWPFVAVSFFLGAFALLPYMALWKPDPSVQSPPTKEDLEGGNKLLMKGAETTVLPGLLLAGSAYLIFNAVTAGADNWMGYLSLFEESRLVHITTLDFCILTALVPFWMQNDAEARGWESRDTLVPILSLLPVVGPCVYLLLRPKSGDQ